MSCWLARATTGPSRRPRLRLSRPGHRENVSPAAGSPRVSTRTSEESRTDIDDEVDGNPDPDGEVPVEAVVSGIAECLHGHPPDVEEERQPERVDDVEEQQRSVKADDG